MSDNKKEISGSGSKKLAETKKGGGLKGFWAKVTKFFREYRSELKKISWPTFAEVVKNTAITLVAVAIVGVIIWLFDWGVGAVRDILITRVKADNAEVSASDIVDDLDDIADTIVSDAEAAAVSAADLVADALAE